jgi:hypothetical protein
MENIRRYTSYGGVRASDVTTSARVERCKMETARQADLIIAMQCGSNQSSNYPITKRDPLEGLFE